MSYLVQNAQQILANANTTNECCAFENITDEQFYAIIERLKLQKVIPRDSFVKGNPFFNFSPISKESQVREIFQDISDPNYLKSMVKNMMSQNEEKDNEIIAKRLSAMQVMSFQHIMLFKVLKCQDENCPNKPREVATHNQYKDYEYECPFYHHDKDRRRMVITPNIDDEFTYKANYSEDSKKNGIQNQKGGHSQNYFESMYHPLYYKMFRCKREYCNLSAFCPFFHSEEEKKTWDRVFSNFIRKDRISYVKDKQKYYENNNNRNHGHNNNNNSGNKQNNGEQKVLRPLNLNGSNNSSPKGYNGNGNRNNNNNNNRTKYNNHKQHNNNQITPPKEHQSGWRSNKSSEDSNASKNSKKYIKKGQNDSGDKFERNSSPVSFGHFYEHKETINRAC